MKSSPSDAPAWLGALCAAGCMGFGSASADVTIQQQSIFDLSIVRAHSDSTEYTAPDRQRHDSVLHCEGFMSLLCGNAEDDEIIRLDRSVQWKLAPKKKEYREIPFLTPAQRREQMQQLQAELDKMKQCPAAQQQPHTAPAPDQSKCQMSPPKFDVAVTDTHATLLGHDARLTQATLTQSCTNPDTGDSCDFVLGMDSWLTQEQILGLEDRRAFERAYVEKLGLTEGVGLEMQAQVKAILAPYADSLKQLAAKAGDFKGFPLKTAFRISFGGPHCAAAQNQNASGGQPGDPGSSGSGPSIPPTSIGGVASALGGKLVGGLFAKKKSDAPADSSTTPTTPLPPGMIQAAQITIETKSITQGTIAPAQFEIPAGWKLIQPEAPKAPKEFTCPKT